MEGIEVLHKSKVGGLIFESHKIYFSYAMQRPRPVKKIVMLRERWKARKEEDDQQQGGQTQLQ